MEFAARDIEFIDTHCHLESEKFDADRDAVIDRALAAGVTRMICVATNADDADTVASLAARRPGVFMVMGLHPHDAKSVTPAVMARFERHATSLRAVAWGEIGLDYHYDFSPRDVQRRVFAEQIHLARKHDLPIVIHSREADDDTLAILAAEAEGPYRGVFHCFAGDAAMASRVMEMGFALSFTGNVTFKPEMPSHEVIRLAGLGRVMTETDAPYMAPKPDRGKRCEPAHVVRVAETFARVLGARVDEVAASALATARRVFPRLA